jgi:hypothetical protein
MKSLENTIEYIIEEKNDIESLKKFFCNSYRVKNYVTRAFKDACSYNKSNYVIYLLENYNKRILNKEILVMGQRSDSYYISLALEYFVNHNNIYMIIYLLRKYIKYLDKPSLDFGLQKSGYDGFLEIKNILLRLYNLRKSNKDRLRFNNILVV